MSSRSTTSRPRTSRSTRWSCRSCPDICSWLSTSCVTFRDMLAIWGTTVRRSKRARWSHLSCRVLLLPRIAPAGRTGVHWLYTSTGSGLVGATGQLAPQTVLGGQVSYLNLTYSSYIVCYFYSSALPKSPSVMRRWLRHPPFAFFICKSQMNLIPRYGIFMLYWDNVCMFGATTKQVCEQ